MVRLEVVATVFALTVPFGCYRSFTTKLSARWFLAIHLPVPFIFLVRIGAGLPYTFIPFTCLAFASGQLVGGWAGGRWRRREDGGAVLRLAYGRGLLATITLTVLAGMTLLPASHHPANILGYGSLCSAAPFSSALLLMVAGLACVARQRSRREARLVPAGEALPAGPAGDAI